MPFLTPARDIPPGRPLVLCHIGPGDGVRDPLIAQGCCQPLEDFCRAGGACSAGQIEFRSRLAKLIEIVCAAREPSDSPNQIDRVRQVPL